HNRQRIRTLTEAGGKVGADRQEIALAGDRRRQVLRVDGEGWVPDDQALLRELLEERVRPVDLPRPEGNRVAEPELSRGVDGEVLAVLDPQEVEVRRVAIHDALQRSEQQLLVGRKLSDVGDVE